MGLDGDILSNTFKKFSEQARGGLYIAAGRSEFLIFLNPAFIDSIFSGGIVEQFQEMLQS